MEHEADVYAMEVTHGLIADQRQVGRAYLPGAWVRTG